MYVKNLIFKINMIPTKMKKAQIFLPSPSSSSFNLPEPQFSRTPFYCRYSPPHRQLKAGSASYLAGEDRRRRSRSRELLAGEVVRRVVLARGRMAGDSRDLGGVAGKMEERKEVVQHVVIAKLKEDLTAEKLEEMINGFAGLVSLIEPMKDFHWGTDVGMENLHQGFTHVFVSTFESTQGVAEYVSHPLHVEFANKFVQHLDKFVVIDYKPTTVNL